MSYGNAQMLEMLVNSIRGDMTIMASSDYQEESSGLSLYTNLTKQLEPLKTWEDFTYSCKTKQLHGTTKHSDLWLLTNYYREGLDTTSAAEGIGYTTANGTRAVNGLYFRLRRINITNPFVIIEPIINKGWMERSTMRYMLSKQHKVHGKFKRFYARFYVLGAFKYFLGDAEKTAKTLDITEDVLKYWLQNVVPDVRVKATIN